MSESHYVRCPHQWRHTDKDESHATVSAFEELTMKVKISNEQTEEGTKSRIINKNTSEKLNKQKQQQLVLVTRDLHYSLRERWCELALKSHQSLSVSFPVPNSTHLYTHES